MTIISDSHRFVFVHIPKSGGTSVKYALGHLQAERFVQHLARLKHVRARELSTLVPEVHSDEWFTFAFVRNPFDQLRSYWTYKTEHPFHPHYAATVRAGGFEGWVRSIAEDPAEQQYSYTHGTDGEPLVDFVGRYETLADDFAAVVERIGCGPVSLPHVNRSSATSEMYPPGLRAFVATHWAADFEAFGYDG